MIYPWQAQQWQHLHQAVNMQHLPHAMLFQGMVGIGKSLFAEEFIKSLLCLHCDHQYYACHRCKNCLLVKHKLHPNIKWLEVEWGKAIKVDQVRELNDFIYQSSFQKNYRFVVINHAHQMNINAANALLKTLEEPPLGAILILITHQPYQLPATILSRCQRLCFKRPDTTIALNWLDEQLKDSEYTSNDKKLSLQYAQGAPLTALQYIQISFAKQRDDVLSGLIALAQANNHPVAVASKIKDYDLLTVLDLYLTWLLDLLRFQSTQSSQFITNQDKTAEIKEITKKTNAVQLCQLIEKAMRFKSEVIVGINLNKLMVIENLLIHWMRCVTCT